MKKLFLFVGFALVMTSCDPDIIDPPGVNDPSVSVSGTPSGEIAAGSTFSITVVGTPTAENQLKSVAFKEDNVNIPFDRITVDGQAAASNPILLFNDEKNGFTWDVDIVAHGDAGIKQYEVEITDDGNNVGGFTFDVETGVTAPSVTVAGNFDVMVPPGAFLKVDATLSKGTFDLATLAIYQGDDLITDFDRVGYQDLTNTIDANPYSIPGADQGGGEITLWLKVQEMADSIPYRLVVADSEDNTGEFTFAVKTGTEVESDMGVLFNAAGPTGTGGLDLDTGEGTGSNDADAEIKDLGIDTDLVPADNWRQRVAATNDAEMRALVPGENGLLEGFSFEGIGTKEMIATLFEDNSAAFTEQVNGEDASDEVEVGDMFVVKRGDNYYAIVIREVNVVPTAMMTDSNSDNYVIDIKR